MNKLKHCILTGYQLKEQINIEQTTGPHIEYTFAPVGKVKIGTATLIAFVNNKQYKNPVLAGLCRNAFEYNQEPPLITSEFIEYELKNLNYPKSFKEKERHLLRYIYERGGNEFKQFTFLSQKDYPICYAENLNEFQTIMERLERRYLISFNMQNLAGGLKSYSNVSLEQEGIDEIQKELPKTPMIGIVNQTIKTGDIDVDEKINYAKDIFFQEPQNFDRLRSACEKLIYVLEPLRQQLKIYFKRKDTEDFFIMVNNFDIRHNKEHTKEIEHPEQFEWLFYSLLNTIYTYTKLKKRL
ncbi:MAG: hypothetical protein ACOCWC_05920 [Bacteroidota bacterium]